MVALRQQGLRLAEIASRYGLSRQRVAQIIDEAGRVHVDQVRGARQDLHADRALARVEEILEHYRAGLTTQQIAVRTGLTYRGIRQAIRELATAEDREQRKLTRTFVSQPAQYSEQQLLAGLRQVAKRLGHAPGSTEYAKGSSELGLASMQTVYMRFGGWRQALSRAGLESPAPAASLRPVVWHVAACWQALLSVADQLGDPPRYRRYLEVAADRDDLPSPTTLRTRLGLWSEIAAALELYRRTHGDAESQEAAA
jgi:uncharacterized protein (DUF433 family)